MNAVQPIVHGSRYTVTLTKHDGFFALELRGDQNGHIVVVSSRNDNVLPNSRLVAIDKLPVAGIDAWAELQARQKAELTFERQFNDF